VEIVLARMDDSDLVPLFSFPCTVETSFFSEDLKKPRRHDADFAVGIRRREADFVIAVKGKADVKRRYYQVRIYLMPFVLCPTIQIHTQLHNAIHSIKDAEWQKGKLTIMFARGPLRRLCVSDATMSASLAECAEFLKKIINGLTVNGTSFHLCLYNLDVFFRVLTE